MINNPTDFERKFTEVFGAIDRTTLSKIPENRLRVELGGEYKSQKERIEQANIRSSQIIRECFQEEIWLRIILWDNNEKDVLQWAGIKIEDCHLLFKGNEIIDDFNVEVLYVYCNNVPYQIIDKLKKLIINYDLAEEPSANITSFLIDFNTQVLVNIYDDRGMDIYSPEIAIINNLSRKFHTWIID